jgi:hypothetical protein
MKKKHIDHLYGMEELKAYLNRNQYEIDKCRGWEYA